MHNEYVRFIPESDTAYLFIHGILGTPNYFTEFVNVLPKSITVRNLLLQGHGKTVKDFPKATMAQWKSQVYDSIEQLAKTHENVIIVAHSMGCLLACSECVDFKDKVKTLFFIDHPLNVFLYPRAVIIGMKVIFGLISNRDLDALAAKEQCSIILSKNIFRYIPFIPKYIELLLLKSKVRRNFPNLDIPCFTFQSLNDELVKKTSIKTLNKNKFTKTILLKNSSHFYYSDEDFNNILSKFKEIANIYVSDDSEISA